MSIAHLGTQVSALTRQGYPQDGSRALPRRLEKLCTLVASEEYSYQQVGDIVRVHERTCRRVVKQPLVMARIRYLREQLRASAYDAEPLVDKRNRVVAAAALARKLRDIGVEDEHISLALDWLNGLQNTQRAEWTCSPLAQRIYTAEEQYRLGAECLSFIMFLETTGVISPHLRELVIEYAMMLDDDSIPLDKFKVIVLMVLWSREEDLEPLIVEELLYDADAELMH